jgi:hypothetical protein
MVCRDHFTTLLCTKWIGRFNGNVHPTMRRGSSWSTRTTFRLMGALCGIVVASGVSNAYPRATREVGPPSICFEEAVLEVQMHVVNMQLDEDIKAVNEAFAAMDSSNNPDEALVVQAGALFEKAQATQLRAQAIVYLFVQLIADDNAAGCELFRLASIS